MTILFVLKAFVLTLCSFVFYSHHVTAIEISVLDQSGNPLANAFVASPEGEISQPSPDVAVMDQVDVAFVPHVLAVDAGQAVIFPNSDNIRHHVYSFSEPKQFEIKLYEGVPKHPVLFDKPGLVVLGCNIHDLMLGYIFVSPWPSYGVTDERGQITLKGAKQEVVVWHPWVENQREPLRVELQDPVDGVFVIELDVVAPTPVKTFSGLRKRYYDD